MSAYQYQQWLLQNGYAVPPNTLPPPGYLSNQPLPYPQRTQPPVAALNPTASQYVYNTYGPNTQLPYGQDYQQSLTTEPGHLQVGHSSKPKHHKHQDEQLAQQQYNPYYVAQVPWHYAQPTAPPPVQQVAGAYYANNSAGDPERFIHTLNTTYGGNMSAALFDPETRQMAHQMGLIDNEDLFDVDLSGDRVSQMKGASCKTRPWHRRQRFKLCTKC